MRMERKYGRGPAQFRQIRILGNTHKPTVVEGITIPLLIANQFRGVFLTIRCTDTQIILESGCKSG